MYFIVLNTNTESVSSEYTPDTKESNFTFHNKCPVCPCHQKDQQGHPMFQPATQDSSLIVLNYRLMILYITNSRFTSWCHGTLRSGMANL